jgi:hypothetical protein
MLHAEKCNSRSRQKLAMFGTSALAVFMTSVIAGAPNQATTKPAQQSNAAVSQPPQSTLTQPATSFDGNELLLKFQQELLAEEKAHRDFLNWAVGIIGTVLLLLAGFSGWKTRKEMDARVAATVRKRIGAMVDEQIREFVAIQGYRIDKTRKKLGKGLENINDAVVTTFPELVNRFAKTLRDGQHDIADKTILWVDDDEPGVNLYVRMVHECGLIRRVHASIRTAMCSLA